MVPNITKERFIILDLVSDGPSLKLLSTQLRTEDNKNCIKTMINKYSMHYQFQRLPLSHITLGTIALAFLNSNDGNSCLSRVQIVDNKMLKIGVLSVLLVDDVKWDTKVELFNLYSCPSEISEMPLLSEVFYLADVFPMDTNVWLNNSIQFLRTKLITTRTVAGMVFRESNKISLFRPFEPNDHNQLLAKTMVQCGLAYISPSFPGLSSFPRNETAFANCTSETSVTFDQIDSCLSNPYSKKFILNKHAPSANLYMIANGPEKHVHSKTSVELSSFNPLVKNCNSKDRFVAIEAEAGLFEECGVTHIENGPWKFCIQITSQDELRVILENELEETAAKGNFNNPIIEKGVPVLCKSKLKNKYYRGIILEENVENISVFLVDNGSVENFSSNSVWALPKHFLNIPVLAMRCRLKGLPKIVNLKICTNFQALVANRTLRATLGGITSDLLTEVYIEVGKFSVLEIVMNKAYGENTLTTDTEVTLSHVSEANGVFYLQHVDNALDELQKEIQKQSSSLNSLHNPSTGQPCLAVYSEDDNWYRAIIVGCEDKIIKVRFVDFGNEEEHLLNAGKLKEISALLLSYLPCKAISCVLQGLKQSALRSEDIFQCISDKGLRVRVTDWVEAEVDDVPTRLPKVHLLEKHSRRSLNQDLQSVLKRKSVHFSSEVCVFGSSGGNSDAISCPQSCDGVVGATFELLKASTSADEELGLAEDWLRLCRVTHLQSEDRFWVNLVHKETDAQRIHLILKNWFQGCPLADPTFLAPGDEAVVASSGGGGDPSFYRAVIKSVTEDGFSLRLIDVGRDEIVQKSKVKLMPNEASVSRFPPQAVQCSLDETLMPLANRDSSIEALLTRRRLALHFTRKENDLWKVNIVEGLETEEQIGSRLDPPTPRHERGQQCTTGRKADCLLEETDKEERRIPPDERRLRTSLEGAVAEREDERRGVPFKDSLHGHFPPEGRRVVKRTACRPPPPPPLSSGEGVFVSFFLEETPRVLWLQRAADSTLLLRIQGDIQGELSEEEAKPPENDLPGDLVLAQSSEDDMWYRARRVAPSDRGTVIAVHYIDFGNSEQVPESKVRALPPCLRQGHPLAYPCKLRAEHVPDRLLAHILASVADEEMIVDVCEKKEDNYVVTLIHKDKPIEEAFTNSTFQIENKLNDESKTVDGLKEKLDKIYIDKPNETVERADETNLTVTELENLKLTTSLAISNVEPPTNTDIELIVSHIENDGSLWVQLSSNSSQLDDLMNNLALLAENAPTVRRCSVGLFCVGKYSADEGWYRAKIISVNELMEELLLFYVDYGNREAISSKDVKVLPKECFDFPAQAIHCYVHSKKLDGDTKTELDWLCELTIRGTLVKSSTYDLILKNIKINSQSLESQLMSKVDLLGSGASFLIEVSQQNGMTNEKTIFRKEDSDFNGSDFTPIPLYPGPGGLFSVAKASFSDLSGRNPASQLPFDSRRSSGVGAGFEKEPHHEHHLLHSLRLHSVPSPSSPFDGTGVVARGVSPLGRESLNSSPASLDTLDDLVLVGTIVHIEEDPFTFYIQMEKDSSLLNAVEVGLSEEVARDLRTPRKIMVGQICASYFMGRLLRAKVLRTSGNVARIQFIDLGQKCSLDSSEVFECPPALGALPALANPFALPVRIATKGDVSSAVSLLLDLCLNRVCAVVDLASCARPTAAAAATARNEAPIAVVAADGVGSIGRFLVDKGLASNLTHKEIVHTELIEEFDAAAVCALKSYLQY